VAVSAEKFRIGDALVEEGLLSESQLQSAMSEQNSSGRMLGEVLVEQQMVSAQALIETLSKRLGVRGCILRDGLIDPPLLKVVGVKEAERLKVIPMFQVHNTLTVAMAEPQSLPTIDRLRRITGCKIKPILALDSNIYEYIKRYADGDVDLQAFISSLAESDVESADVQESTADDSVLNLDETTQDNPVIKLVNLALITAIRNRGSDIHIEPSQQGSRVRYRVDGALRDLMQPPAGMHAAIVSRVKVIGRMDIAEKRLPQEGRAQIIALGRQIDLRISSMPMLLGEKLVIRVLDKSNLNTQMEDLGFRSPVRVAFEKILRHPHGLVLVTGPTGSGKTTTLYSALDLIKSPEKNIITVEDPVEYQLDLINQVQVQESIGMTFARALRSILRQDPDIIMVGEIRDEETARVAVQAALTGHLVLATLHTNDAPGAVSRLLNMGIESYLLSGALIGVIAQRLARTVCPGCASQYTPDQFVLDDAGLTQIGEHTYRRGIGCQQCHDTGCQGRLGVYELMVVTPELRRMINRAAPTHQLREKMHDQGCLTLREEGVLIAQAGKVSLEEVLRVSQDESDESNEDTGSQDGRT